VLLVFVFVCFDLSGWRLVVFGCRVLFGVLLRWGGGGGGGGCSMLKSRSRDWFFPVTQTNACVIHRIMPPVLLSALMKLIIH